MFASCVHPVAVLNAVFCMTFSLLMLVEDERGDHIEEELAPDDTAYKLWNCHSGFGKLLCRLYRNLPPQQWRPDLRLLRKPAMRTRCMAGAAPHKDG